MFDNIVSVMAKSALLKTGVETIKSNEEKTILIS